VPQRQMLPDIAASISASLGSDFSPGCRGRHDLARLAVTALHDLQVQPRLLNFLRPASPDRLDV